MNPNESSSQQAHEAVATSGERIAGGQAIGSALRELSEGHRTATEQVLRALAEGNRHQAGVLRINVHQYQQEAAQTILATRESDLQMGQRLAATISESGGKETVYWQVAMAIFALSLQMVVELVPDELIGKETKFQIGICVITIMLLAVFCLMWRDWSKGHKLSRLKTGLQEISNLYAQHSELKLKVQSGTQARVVREALLEPSHGKTWEEIADSGNVLEVREHLKRIAEIDLNRTLDEQEYNRQGGDYWFELLQAGLRGQVPTFVCLYVNRARKRDQETVEQWKHSARALCKAAYSLKRLTKMAYRAFLRRIDATDRFSWENLQHLLEACKHNTDYRSSRSDPKAVQKYLPSLSAAEATEK